MIVLIHIGLRLVIKQWGNPSLNSTQVDIELPISYPTTYIGMVSDDRSRVNNGVTTLIGCSVTNLSKIRIVSNETAYGMFWFTIGY